MADDVSHYDAVEAYCDRLSYLPGEGVALQAWCATDRFDDEFTGATPGRLLRSGR